MSHNGIVLVWNLLEKTLYPVTIKSRRKKRNHTESFPTFVAVDDI